MKQIISISIIWLITGIVIGITINKHVTKEDKKSNITFIWEGLDKDIPEDGIHLIQLRTNIDTVYLNPVDE